MPVTVKARVLLELGAELISSDQIAIYELVKNSLDAKASRIDVEVHVTLQRSDYVTIRQSVQAMLDKKRPVTSEMMKSMVESRLEPSAPAADRKALLDAVVSAKPGRHLEALEEAYARTNWIEIKDDGVGMSLQDLGGIYLTVGTPNRLLQRQERGAATVLGEKGIGRLSAVRLGDRLLVVTSMKGERAWNELSIDWALIKNNPNLDMEDFPAEPHVGSSKPKAADHGTAIRVCNLTSEWSVDKLESLARTDFAKLVDPFESSLPRPNVRLLFNSQSVDIPAFQPRQLTFAHAHCTANFDYTEDGEPTLSGEVNYKAYGQTKVFNLESTHLFSTLALKGKKPKTKDDPPTLEGSLIHGLTSLGPFSMEAHWFNRQKLRLEKPEGYEAALNWLTRWGGGLLLYRDSYRVYPYAETRDDWLDLDGIALATQGYKMNRKQIVGAVRITSRGNPQLMDQTNREGLRDTEEKSAMIALLRHVLIVEFKSYLNAIEGQQDESAAKEFPKLEKRLDTAQRQALKQVQILRTKVSDKDDVAAINTLMAKMADVTESWERAKVTVRSYERDLDTYFHLANVGLMTEFIFHELGRLSAQALKVIQTYKPGTAAEGRKLRTLKDQLGTLEKRIRVLDPLSTPGRQRKESFDLVQAVRDLFELHEPQLERHAVAVDLSALPKQPILITAVRGQVLAILENFLANAVYWLKVQSKVKTFDARVKVSIDPAERTLTFLDNGPGIPVDRGEEVFNAFFTTKPSGEGRGLGLYISRKLAEGNALSLSLSEPDEERIHHGFVITYGGAEDGDS